MPDDLIRITLAGAPKGKGRPRFVRATGHAFTPERTRSYEAALRFAAQEAMGNRTPLDGALGITVIARMPIPVSWSRKKRAVALNGFIRPTTKPDVDNLVKTLDALNNVVWIDDRQICSCRIFKLYHEKPSLDIIVWPMYVVS
jgi:Holliday junction resolvase RusA-like endonuclease